MSAGYVAADTDNLGSRLMDQPGCVEMLGLNRAALQFTRSNPYLTMQYSARTPSFHPIFLPSS